MKEFPMKKYFLLLLFASSIFGQTYRQVKIYVNNNADIKTLASFGLALDHYERTKENAIITFLNDAEFTRLSMLNFRYQVLIDDWIKYYKSRPQMSQAEKKHALQKSAKQFGVTGFGYGSMGGYYTYDEVIQKVDDMRTLYPNLISAKDSIGTTDENRTLYVVKISDNPDIDENEPEVLYTSLIHAREPESMMQMIYFMYYLLENYGTNETVTYLVNNRQLFFLPVINPDGYVYNQTMAPNGGGMWRKNKHDNGGSYGIDLNRNFGPTIYWNAPNGGSSVNPNDETYRGTNPFSEKETAAIANFLLTRKIKAALNYHTYSNLLIYPYGALEKETADSTIFREFSSDMTKYNHYTPGLDQTTVGYSTRGNSDDFMYDGSPDFGKIFAMTPEVGSGSDGFWPNQNRIFPLAEENLFPNLYYAWIVGGYASLSSYTFDKMQYFRGDTLKISAEIKNKGLSDVTGITVSLKELNGDATISNAVRMIQQPINARESVHVNSGFTCVLSPTLKNGDMVHFVLSISMNNISMESDTLLLRIGMANLFYADTSDVPTTQWLISSNVSQKWGAVSSTYVTAPTSFTDSPLGNYLSNSTDVMTLKHAINLKGITNPILSFWTKFDIENDWDCGLVQISSDGGNTWTTVGGKHANPGAGQGRQPSGVLVYDGMQPDWVKEEIDLNDFADKSIKIRFSFLSDEAVEKDGWYLDGISIITYDNITSA